MSIKSEENVWVKSILRRMNHECWKKGFHTSEQIENNII